MFTVSEPHEAQNTQAPVLRQRRAGSDYGTLVLSDIVGTQLLSVLAIAPNRLGDGGSWSGTAKRDCRPSRPLRAQASRVPARSCASGEV